MEKRKELEGLSQQQLPGTLRIAWCSVDKHLVTVDDIYRKSKARVMEGDTLGTSGSTFVAPIADKLLSSITSFNQTKFTIFDVNKCKSVFSSGKVAGDILDATYNEKQNIAAFHSSNEDREAKKLFCLFSTETFEVIKQTAWNPIHKDFNPEGSLISIIDEEGRFSVSNISTTALLANIEVGQFAHRNRCRWNPNCDDAIIAIKFDSSSLNLVDVEKQVMLLEESVTLDKNESFFPNTYWIDWRNDGKLLASCGADKIIKIFDKGEGKIVKTINAKHKEYVNSVRWSPCGNYLVTASDDKQVKVTEFSSENVIHSATTPDGSSAFSACFV